MAHSQRYDVQLSKRALVMAYIQIGHFFADQRSTFHITLKGRGTPFPLVHLLPHLFPLLRATALSFIGFTYFLLLSIPSLSTRIVPLRFQAGGRRRRPNLVLVYFVCVICIP